MVESDPDGMLDRQSRCTVIEQFLQLLQTHYPFPEVASSIEESLREHTHQEDEGFSKTAAIFCEGINATLLAISRDRHLRLLLDVTGMRIVGDDGQESLTSQSEYAEVGRLENYGFARVERLPGNLGYLDVRFFYLPQYAGETAVAAMRWLAHTSALIIDLRRHGGGSPLLGFLLSSYLLGAEPVHLNDYRDHATGKVRPGWTLPYVPGPRYGEKPVFLLTSMRTVSAGEMFAYDLQAHNRAIVVGETTAGAANPGALFRLTDRIVAFIPTGLVINAVTGSNWEGTGVIPDIALPQEEALRTAQVAALKGIIASSDADATVAGQTLRREARQALAEFEPA